MVRAVGWFHYLVAFGFLLTSCHRPSGQNSAAPSASTPSTSAPVTPLVERAVSGEAAFDLVVTPDGGVLAWGRPKAAGAELGVAVLDALGNAESDVALRGAPLADAIVEVSAATVAGRIGIAWLARTGTGATTWAALGDPSTRSFGEATPLGDSTLGDASQRGHLAVAASDKGELIVLRRGPDEACQTERGHTCASYAFRELLSTGPEARGLPLSVPVPCGHGLAGFALMQGRWHYAVCSELDGRSAITAFNIQRSPFYAEAKKVLEGCTPLGATAIGGEIIVVGECADGRRGVRFAGMGAAPRSLELAKSSLACERGRPVLRASGDAPFELVFDVARDAIAPLLPLGYAPANARAAWTGSSLLVASWVGQKLVLRRYECRGEELARTG